MSRLGKLMSYLRMGQTINELILMQGFLIASSFLDERDQEKEE